MLHLSVSSNRGASKGGGRGSGLKEYMVKKDLKFLFSLGVNKKKRKRREEKRFFRN